LKLKNISVKEHFDISINNEDVIDGDDEDDDGVMMMIDACNFLA